MLMKTKDHCGELATEAEMYNRDRPESDNLSFRSLKSRLWRGTLKVPPCELEKRRPVRARAVAIVVLTEG
jgi:hypothetical protein